MKRIIPYTVLVFCIMFSLRGVAQPKGERVESIKVAFLSERLNLDPKTAERFWPIYNQYEEEMKTVIQDSKRADENRSADDILEREQRALDIKKKYSAQFLRVINQDQLGKLYQSEREFYQMLIRRKNKMQDRQQSMRNRENMEFPNRPMRPGSRFNQKPSNPATPSNPNPSGNDVYKRKSR